MGCEGKEEEEAAEEKMPLLLQQLLTPLVLRQLQMPLLLLQRHGRHLPPACLRGGRSDAGVCVCVCVSVCV